MKKLSILVALILCVTVGGVYAVWTYSGTDDVVDTNAEVKVVLEAATLDGSIGAFSAESNLTLSIDQKAGSNHIAELVFKSNDSNPIFMTFTFTPSAGADMDIKNNGIPAEIYQKATTEMQYPMDASGNYKADGTKTDVFKFENESDGTFTANVTWEKQADGTFTVTYNEAQLKEMIKLNYDFQLDTKDEHDEFYKILNGNIRVHITDGKGNIGS